MLAAGDTGALSQTHQISRIRRSAESKAFVSSGFRGLLLDDLLVLQDRVDDLGGELLDVGRRLDLADHELGGDDVGVPAGRGALAAERLGLAEDDERRVGADGEVGDGDGDLAC